MVSTELPRGEVLNAGLVLDAGLILDAGIILNAVNIQMLIIQSPELKYKQKCQDLRKRIREIEKHNEIVTISIARTKRAIKRVRLERAILLEKLEEKTLLNPDDSDGTQSTPGSPSATEEYKNFCELERDNVAADNTKEDVDQILAVRWEAMKPEERDKYRINGQEKPSLSQTIQIESKPAVKGDESEISETDDQSDMPPPSSDI